MAIKDYYAILGVSKNSSIEDIRKAYRKLAIKYHPDKNPGDKAAEEKFKEINEAYDVLKDPKKKANYDQFGSADSSGFGGSGAEGFDFSGGFSSFSDIFEEMFGQAYSGQKQSNRGSDIRYDLTITLEEAFSGTKKPIQFTTFVICDRCSGRGQDNNQGPTVCPTCGGRGSVRHQQAFITIERTCQTCGGRGSIISNPCKKCSGSGRVKGDRNLQLTVPSGIENEQELRIAEAGEAGFQGGSSGDLYVFINILPHDLYKVKNKDLYCIIYIPMTAAIMGITIQVPDLAHKLHEIKIPHGTQTGTQIRIAGAGMPYPRSVRRGDILVEIVVETPVELSKEQQNLIEQFALDPAVSKNNPKSQACLKKMQK